MNRKIAPEYKNIGRTPLIRPESRILENKIPLFIFNVLQAELVKVEWVFKIKIWDWESPLNPSAAAKLMDDGTLHKTSAQIIEEIDFYGSYFQVHITADLISLELYSLRKYLPKTLSIIYEILNEAQFPESEIDLYRIHNIRRLQVDQQKVQKRCSRLFYSTLLGAKSRYGYGESIADYEKLEFSGILDSYRFHFQSSNCTLIASGKIEESELKAIEEFFGNRNWGYQGSLPPLPNSPSFLKMVPGYHFEPIAGTSQSAIKIGKPMVLKSHPDFPALQILNTVLGGYFGSRLMANIREDKGFSYGIGSTVNAFEQMGIFYISTEVNAEFTGETLVEIKKEITVLKTELISVEELDRVKNFIRGSFLGSLETAFSYADKFKSIYFQNLDYTYYDRLFEAVEEAEPKSLKKLAEQYWDWDTFNTVIVGKE